MTSLLRTKTIYKQENAKEKNEEETNTKISFPNEFGHLPLLRIYGCKIKIFRISPAFLYMKVTET